VEIGGNNLLAGLCQSFTTVVCRSTSYSTPPVTNVARILDLDVRDSDEMEFYQSCLSEGQKSYSYLLSYDISLENAEPGRAFGRERFQLPDDAFVVVVVGNRLDTEVTDEVISVLIDILCLSEKIYLLFVGTCEGLQKRMQEHREYFRMRFAGIVDPSEIKQIIGLADLFLNPPRQGGGTTAQYAMKEQVPVLTLPEGDVAGIVGKHFFCDSLGQMPDYVRRYLEEDTFMEVQKSHCKEYVSQRGGIDACANLSLFCKELICDIGQ